MACVWQTVQSDEPLWWRKKGKQRKKGRVLFSFGPQTAQNCLDISPGACGKQTKEQRHSITAIVTDCEVLKRQDGRARTHMSCALLHKIKRRGPVQKKHRSQSAVRSFISLSEHRFKKQNTNFFRPLVGCWVRFTGMAKTLGPKRTTAPSPSGTRTFPVAGIC